MSTVDRFPNFLSGTLVESAAATFTTERVATPIPRLPAIGRGRRATIMELLWVDVTLTGGTLNADNESVIFEMTIGSAPTALLGLGDPRTIQSIRRQMYMLTTGASVVLNPIRFSFQDANGFGYLLATDAFNVSIQGAATSAAFTANWRLYYRFVDVDVEEYVGIVQSTQT